MPYCETKYSVVSPKKKEYKDRTIIQYETEDEKMQKDFQIDVTSW